MFIPCRRRNSNFGLSNRGLGLRVVNGKEVTRKIRVSLKKFAILKMLIMSFAATWTVILSEVSRRKTNIVMISLVYGTLKKSTNELINKTDIELQM